MPSGKKNTSSKKNKKNKKKIGKDEELLFERVKRGEEEAMNKVISNYSNLVYNIARKYHNCFKNYEVEELAAEGNRGVLEAVEHYDSSMSTKFTTYAWFWIIKNMQEYISSGMALIGMPRKIFSNLKKVVKSIENEIKKGKTPSLTEISKKLDLDLEKVRDLLYNKKNLTKPLSLDKYLDKYDQDATLADIVPDESLSTMQEILDQSESKMDISRMLDKLSPIEMEVIQWRYGFKDNRYHTLKEIGEKLNISPSKIKDIESVAIVKLKRLAINSKD
ncbi:MAG: sigma-70 family RNA polymerase sigma factor [Endomicrobiales bacterium]|nr:sigma-70 family RNA polymerase sigma factor [Endomicrobiales bacterium]